MTLDEIRTVLHTAAKVRMPRFTDDMSSRERVDALEDYLNLTAVTRADLEEARLYAHGAHKELSSQLDAIEGWEVHLRRRRSEATQADIAMAKAEILPDIAAGAAEAKWLISRLSEQISRLSNMGDDAVASRLYTIITTG